MFEDIWNTYFATRGDRLGWLAALVVLVAVIERTAVLGRRAWRRRRALADQRTARHAAEAALRAKEHSPEFHHAVLGHLFAIDPRLQRPDFQHWRDLALAMQDLEVAFESEGLAWYVEHANEGQVQHLVDVAGHLDLAPMAGPLRDLLPLIGWYGEPGGDFDGDTEHPEYKRFLTRLAAIEARFEALGGVALFRDRVGAALRADLPDIAAAGVS